MKNDTIMDIKYMTDLRDLFDSCGEVRVETASGKYRVLTTAEILAVVNALDDAMANIHE
jgi:hypothetical protein